MFNVLADFEVLHTVVCTDMYRYVQYVQKYIQMLGSIDEGFFVCFLFNYSPNHFPQQLYLVSPV